MSLPSAENRRPALSVREHRTLEEFRSLEPVWNDLVKRSGNSSLYLTYDWLSTWWERFGSGRCRLCILTVTEGAEMLGIAPFMEVRRHWLFIPYCTIEFISAPKYAFSSLTLSGILDIIALARAEEVLEAVLLHLSAARAPWAYIRLVPVAGDGLSSLLVPRLASRFGLRPLWGASSEAYEIRFDEGWEGFVRAKGRDHLKAAERDERRFHKQARAGWEDVGGDGDPAALFRTILEVERTSWKWTHGMSINAVGYAGFFEAFLTRAARNGWLRLTFLREEGRAVAYVLGARFEETVEVMKMSYDPSRARFSPGRLALWHYVRRAAAEGVRTLNLHIGGKENKIQWATHPRAYAELFLLRNTPRARLLCLFLFTFRLYGRFRIFPDVAKRLLRRLGFSPRWSELTRTDQV